MTDAHSHSPNLGFVKTVAAGAWLIAVLVFAGGCADTTSANGAFTPAVGPPADAAAGPPTSAKAFEPPAAATEFPEPEVFVELPVGQKKDWAGRCWMRR
jgi:hypothetical protein